MKTVYLYEGNIPRSGKSFILFGGHKLNHLSKGVDGSDYLVHQETKIIIRAYPKKTIRSKVLNDLASNLVILEHFLDHQEEYELMVRPKVSKAKEVVLDSNYKCFKEPSFSNGGDTSCASNCSSKKSYNVLKEEW